MSETTLRIRLLLAKYQWLVAVVAVVAVVGGVWLTYGAYVAEPDTVQEERLEDSWSISGEFTHGTTVETENELFPVGTELENEPIYYTTLSPTANGTYVAGYEGIDGEDVTVSITADLVTRAVDDDTVYWRETDRLETVTEPAVSPGENVTATVSLNATALEDRVGEIERSLGASPGTTETVVVVEVTYDGTVAGDRWTDAETATIDVESGGTTYAFDGGTFERSVETYDTVRLEQSPGLLERVGGPIATLLGVAVLGALGLARRAGLEPTAAEREWLAYRRELESVAELITPVALPESVLERPEADVPSLQALSEFAIDVGAAIVADEQRGRYVVVHEDLLYVYVPPTDPTAEGHEGTTLLPPSGREAAAESDGPLSSVRPAVTFSSTAGRDAGHRGGDGPAASATDSGDADGGADDGADDKVDEPGADEPAAPAVDADGGGTIE